MRDGSITLNFVQLFLVLATLVWVGSNLLRTFGAT